MAKGGISIESDGEMPIVTTRPEHILRHNISDEELDMLCEAKSDMVREFFLIALGSALGTIHAAFLVVQSMWVVPKGQEFVPQEGDIAVLMIFCVSVALSVVVGLIGFSKWRRSNSLRETIRNRSKREKQPDQAYSDPLAWMDAEQK